MTDTSNILAELKKGVTKRAETLLSRDDCRLTVVSLKDISNPENLAFYQDEEIILFGERHNVRRLYVGHMTDEFEGVGWIVNEDIDFCMVCGKVFGFFLYRHHCRSCGNIVCSTCSPETAVIEEMKSLGPQRVCVLCYWGQEPVYAAHARPDILTEEASDKDATPPLLLKQDSIPPLTRSPVTMAPAAVETEKSKNEVAMKSSFRNNGKNSSFSSSGRSNESAEIGNSSNGSKRATNSRKLSIKLLPNPSNVDRSDADMVTPTPVVVIKSKTEDDEEQKIFVNLCHHRQISAESILRKDGKEVPVFILGEMRDISDKDGEDCLLCDVSMNTTRYAACLETQEAKQELIRNVLFFAENELSSRFERVVNISRDFKLPKTSNFYKGGEVLPIFIPRVTGKTPNSKSAAQELQAKVEKEQAVRRKSAMVDRTIQEDIIVKVRAKAEAEEAERTAYRMQMQLAEEQRKELARAETERQRALEAERRRQLELEAQRQAELEQRKLLELEAQRAEAQKREEERRERERLDEIVRVEREKVEAAAEKKRQLEAKRQQRLEEEAARRRQEQLDKERQEDIIRQARKKAEQESQRLRELQEQTRQADALLEAQRKEQRAESDRKKVEDGKQVQLSEEREKRRIEEKKAEEEKTKAMREEVERREKARQEQIEKQMQAKVLADAETARLEKEEEERLQRERDAIAAAEEAEREELRLIQEKEKELEAERERAAQAEKAAMEIREEERRRQQRKVDEELAAATEEMKLGMEREKAARQAEQAAAVALALDRKESRESRVSSGDSSPRVPSSEPKEASTSKDSSTNVDVTPTTVTPIPGLVIKTKMLDGKKVFINLCHHEFIAANPAAVTSSRASMSRKSVVAGQDSAFCFVLGDVRPTADKEGEESILVDVIINSEVFKRCVQDPKASAKEKLCVETLQVVGTALQSKLDLDYKLPRTTRNYKGGDVLELDISSDVDGFTVPRDNSSKSNSRGSLPGPALPIEDRPSLSRKVSFQYAPPEVQAKWGMHLQNGEKIVAAGPVGKKNPMGITQTRVLIVTDGPRIMYVDPKSNTVKGEIWCPSRKPIVASSINHLAFEVKTAVRTYQFNDTEKGAAYWTKKINTTYQTFPSI